MTVVSLLATPAALVARVQRDVRQGVRRAQNGAKYVAGIDPPEVGRTPKDVVWRHDRAELWRYRSDTVTARTPVLVVMSLISRSYVLDLYPGASFVQSLRDDGFDVFLLDWGVPDERDACNGLSYYVDDVLPAAVDAVLDASGADQVNVIGYCYGGLLSLLLAAAHDDLPVASLVTMATPVEFRQMGLLGRLLARGRLDPEDVVDDTGNVPASQVHRAFRILRPTGDLASYATLWEKLGDDRQLEAYRAMAQWTRDHVPFPGEAFRDTVRILRSHALVDDAVELDGRRLRLADVRWPLLNVVAQKDHIVPCGAALPVTDLVGSERAETLELPAGHVALVMGRLAATTTIPGIARWLRRHDAAGSPAG
ncbi:MAG: alpha/beta fold hydrolase [Actinomycetes bacterium]